ncbi:spermidine synthase [Kangiella sediminilitoris]|uniref:Polyamine aminopropyltransferase n=1 Tax=Kangiella sediminilitoris TaxID=1144748 RepID=A0A1B3B9L3_9GAMM|nr:fused MFS/spermidine synthase [Kangiella sediminilitoris]AOE49448.1 Spermine synthase [Kangiella sediminilitoris]
MNKLLHLFLASTCVFITALIAAPAEAKILEEERSLYQNVYMVQEHGYICMRFRKKSHNDLSQSCIFEDGSKQLVFDYYKLAMGATFFLDEPKDILVIGLGGGVLVNHYKEIYPEANITSVEIDEVVADMARKYFSYTDEGEQYKTHIRDGRVFVKRAQRKDQRYDFILLDAFNSDYIPEHMMTKEYLEEVKSILKPGGIIMANTFSSSALFHHESETYHEVFGELYQIRFEDEKTNRVIVVSNEKLPEKRSLLKKVNQLKGIMMQYGVDSLRVFDAINTEVNWDTSAKILTDQYSPANLLK